MYKNKTFLAIIPARSGSKRLPRKNILDLNGKPLLAYTIEAGAKSRYIDEVIVTSDGVKIVDVAQQYGASVVRRPKELASDTATTFDAIRHTIMEISEDYDYIVLLQPTSPLRNEKHIDMAIETLVDKDAAAIVSVCEVTHSPLWSNTLPSDGSMSHFISEKIKDTRSQDLEKFYRLNGAIYICDTVRLLEEKSFFLRDNIYAFIMNKKSSIDIDDEIDFQLAEFFMKKREENV